MSAGAIKEDYCQPHSSLRTVGPDSSSPPQLKKASRKATFSVRRCSRGFSLNARICGLRTSTSSLANHFALFFFSQRYGTKASKQSAECLEKKVIDEKCLVSPTAFARQKLADHHRTRSAPTTSCLPNLLYFGYSLLQIVSDTGLFNSTGFWELTTSSIPRIIIAMADSNESKPVVPVQRSTKPVSEALLNEKVRHRCHYMSFMASQHFRYISPCGRWTVGV